ncbi:MAG TPA: hypothetical protein VH396_16800 [Chitinophagaceae bacterium]|jgi:hypothetical protein
MKINLFRQLSLSYLHFSEPVFKKDQQQNFSERSNQEQVTRNAEI